MRPPFIRPFTVIAKKGLVYTINLPRKWRTHPVFYVGLHKPYSYPFVVHLEALVPTKVSVSLIDVSALGYRTFYANEVDHAPGLVAKSLLTLGAPPAKTMHLVLHIISLLTRTSKVLFRCVELPRVLSTSIVADSST